MRRTTKTVGVLAAATSLVITAAGASFADNVYNTLDASVDAAAEAMSLTAGGAVGTTQLKIDSTNGDGKPGCNLTGSTTLTLDLASSAPATATVSPSQVTFASCGDVKDLTVTGLAAGTADITASQASNTTGATFDLTPVKFTVTVAAANATPTPPADATAPAAPSIDLLAASDTGASDTDNITFDTTPTLTGVAEAGSTVEVFDGATLLGSTPAAATGGAWAYTPAALSSGNYSFTATAKDAAGNVSAASSPLTVTVDTTAPVQPSINLVAASDTGSSSTDNVTSDSTPTLDGTAEAGSSVKIFDGATLLDTVTAGSAGTWTATTGLLSDGTHFLTAQATDIAGNVSEASLTLTVTTDTAAPAAPSIDLDATSDTGASDSDNVTKDTTLTLNGLAEAGSTVEVFDGGTSLGEVTASDTGWSYTSTALGAGSHVFTATAKDAAGNVSAASSPLTVTVDTTAPTSVTFVNGPEADTRYYTGTVPAAPTCTATDDLSGLASCTVTGYSTVEGTHTLTATAKDNAGNTTTATRTYTIKNLTRSGFYAPVDMNGVYNTIKGGNTVPLKFEVFDGSTELKTTAAVAATFTAAKVNCTTGSEDAIEVFTTTGQTELRFDTTSDQFIQNWKTPTGSGCYRATLTTADGQSISALFKTLK